MLLCVDAAPKDVRVAAEGDFFALSSLGQFSKITFSTLLVFSLRINLQSVFFITLLQIADRLGGEGTGAPFGLTEAGPGWAILLTFGLVWAVYAISAKDLGGGESDDSGLSL